MSQSPVSGRLSIFAAAMVVARRDFSAILLSRSFIFFLLGPLFPLLVGGLAGGIGQSVQDKASRPQLGIAMQAADVDAMLRAEAMLATRLAGALPELVVVKRLARGETIDAAQALTGRPGNLAAILTGSPREPRLTGSADRIAQWQGPVSLVAAQTLGGAPQLYPGVKLAPLTGSAADQTRGRVLTAQAGQTLLFLLTMLLAGMVLSNLVEEKGNKIIEILAAAIPLDALFLGKLFAMLGVSLVGIAIWGVSGTAIWLVLGKSLPALTPPAVGWPAFFALGTVYFVTGYLLLGSLFLAIGSMASTVREVQTLSMPVTMMQLLVYFFASYAMAQPGNPIELGAIIFPFSSPFAMVARAAQDPRLWIHGAALAWQLVCVALFVRGGAALFRKRVMQSGPARGKARSRGFFRRAPAATPRGAIDSPVS